jgi:threonine synthase
MSGVETISCELAEQLPEGINHVFCPAGAGGLALAVARGFGVLGKKGPAVECVQPEGNDTIATPLREDADQARDVVCRTKVSGLQVPQVIDGHEALRACRASGGTGHVVTDEEVWQAQARLACEEGIFCEPAAAASVAGLLRAAAERRITPEARVVCLITGSGFKDQPSVDRMLRDRSCPMIDLTDFR